MFIQPQRLSLPAVLASLALPATANMTGITGMADVSIENSHLYTLEAGARYPNGLTVTGEYRLDTDTRQRQCLTGKLLYRYPLDKGFYAEPELAYGKALGERTWRVASDNAVRPHDLIKAGLRLGWMGDPYFASVRYRYDRGGIEFRSSQQGKNDLSVIHRTDLTLGKHFQALSFQGNWVHEHQATDLPFDHLKKSLDTLELTLTYTAMEAFKPYVQWSFSEPIPDRNHNTYRHHDGVKLGFELIF